MANEKHLGVARQLVLKTKGTGKMEFTPDDIVEFGLNRSESKHVWFWLEMAGAEVSMFQEREDGVYAILKKPQ